LQVEKTALSIEPKLNVELCGSYRRGKTNCGDVDILITRPDNVLTDILSCLTAQLKESGTFINNYVVHSCNSFLTKIFIP
jgi:DNA polymerase lambda